MFIIDGCEATFHSLIWVLQVYNVQAQNFVIDNTGIAIYKDAVEGIAHCWVEFRVGWMDYSSLGYSHHIDNGVE